MAAALFLTTYNLAENRQAEEAVRSAAEQLEKRLSDHAKETASEKKVSYEGQETEQEIPDYILNPDMEMPVEQMNGWEYVGVLQIPDLGLELSVMSSWSYPQLRISPCRYSGSAYNGNLIIAAHNYQSHFGRLQELTEGSHIIFTDMDGNQFQYEVVVRETLFPTDVEEMESEEWDLTLFTCTVGGQYRVTVRCSKTD